MNELYKKDIEDMVSLYRSEDLGSTEEWLSHSTQYDDTSARINYSFVRHYKPSVVVEFGAKTGRCTHDILKALLKNGKPFVFKSYEKSEERDIAQAELNRIFGSDSIEIGGNIMEELDTIPDNIDYLFIDNSHDVETTNWVFDYLLKKCSPNAIIHFHDLAIGGNFEVLRPSFAEQDIIVERGKGGTLPIKKIFWSAENYGASCQSTWWCLK